MKAGVVESNLLFVAYIGYLGMDRWVAANVTTVLGGLMVVGKISAGVASDYIGRANMCTICTTMTGVVFFTLWLPATNMDMIWAFASFFGLFGGGFIGKKRL
jgi:hypothetical protein